MTSQGGGGGGSPIGPAGGLLGGTYPNPTAADGTLAASVASQFIHLAADVNITPINTYVTVLQLSLAAGAWILLGSVTVIQSVSNAGVEVALWDGSAYFGSGEVVILAGSNRLTLTAFARVTPVVLTTYSLRVATTAIVTAAVAATSNNSVGNNATSLLALKTV